MTAPVDEYFVHRLKGFDGKKLMSATEDCVDPEDVDEKNKMAEIALQGKLMDAVYYEVLLRARSGQATNSYIMADWAPAAGCNGRRARASVR